MTEGLHMTMTLQSWIGIGTYDSWEMIGGKGVGSGRVSGLPCCKFMLGMTHIDTEEYFSWLRSRYPEVCGALSRFSFFLILCLQFHYTAVTSFPLSGLQIPQSRPLSSPEYSTIWPFRKQKTRSSLSTSQAKQERTGLVESKPGNPPLYRPFYGFVASGPPALKSRNFAATPVLASAWRRLDKTYSKTKVCSKYSGVSSE